MMFLPPPQEPLERELTIKITHGKVISSVFSALLIPQPSQFPVCRGCQINSYLRGMDERLNKCNISCQQLIFINNFSFGYCGVLHSTSVAIAKLEIVFFDWTNNQRNFDFTLLLLFSLKKRNRTRNISIFIPLLTFDSCAFPRNYPRPLLDIPWTFSVLVRCPSTLRHINSYSGYFIVTGVWRKVKVVEREWLEKKHPQETRKTVCKSPETRKENNRREAKSSTSRTLRNLCSS